MIQRIQSIWLLLAAIAIFLTFKFPFYTGINSNAVSSGHLLIASSTFLLLLTTAVTGMLAFINIFLYKKRTLQLRLCVVGILLEMLLIFLYFREIQYYIQGTYSLAGILHLLSLVSFFLAAKGINKDRKLIKYSDRLR